MMKKRDDTRFSFIAKVLFLAGIIGAIVNILVLLLIPQQVSNLLSLLANGGRGYQKSVILILLFSLLAALTASLKEFSIAYVSTEGVAKLRTIFFTRIANLPGEVLSKIDSGKMASHMVNDAEKVGFLYGQKTVNIIEASFMLIGTLYFLIKIDAYFFFIILGLSLFAPLVQILSSNMVKKRQKNILTSTSNISKGIIKFIGSALIYFPYARQEQYIHSFKKTVNENYKDKLKLSALLSVISAIVQISNQTSLVMVIIIGAFRIENGGLTFADLSAFILYLNYLSSPLQSLGQLVVSVRMAKASEEIINDFAKDKYKKEKEPSLFSDEIKMVEIPSTPVNASPSCGNPIKSFQICKGQKMLLVGDSGAGKTQLLRSIAKLSSTYDVSYNNNLYKKGSKSVYPKILYLDQEQYTIPDTVKNNFFHDVSLTPFFKDFSFVTDSKEMSFYLSKNTEDMSRGERQRIALIRALSDSAVLLLLDEPTSNLDDKNCQIFIEYIRRLKEKTILVASHDTRLINSNIWSQIIHI